MKHKERHIVDNQFDLDYQILNLDVIQIKHLLIINHNIYSGYIWFTAVS